MITDSREFLVKNSSLFMGNAGNLCCSAYLEWEKEQERYNIQEKVNSHVIEEINNESVFVVGNNIHGELTIRSPNIEYLFNFTMLNREYVTNIKSGHYCTFYSDKHYKNIFVSGNNQSFTCINDHPSIFNSSLDTITWFKDHALKIKQICVNHVSLSTFWITTNNQIYANGINHNGELGIGHHKKQIWPQLIPELSKNINVLDIVSNPRYSMALCGTDRDMIISIINYWCQFQQKQHLNSDIINLIHKFYEINTIYSTTSFEDGEKWHNGKWRKVSLFDDRHVLKIRTGLKHSLILEDNGSIWCFGSNTFGELGIGDNTEYEEIDKPMEIPYFIESKIIIIDIKCGSEHNLAISKSHKLYSWGLNASRQCAVGTVSFIYKPQLIEQLSSYKIIGIECGHRHSYAKSQCGLNWLFGSNEYNECITYDKRRKIKDPFCINDIIKELCNGKYVKSVSLGYYNTKIIVRNPKNKYKFAERRDVKYHYNVNHIHSRQESISMTNTETTLTSTLSSSQTMVSNLNDPTELTQFLSE